MLTLVKHCSIKLERPRLYAGYSRVQSQLTKQIKPRTNVYSKWNIAKDIWSEENCFHQTDINNSDFGNAILH